MSAHDTTVAESFAHYAASVLPKDAPPIQILECRRAYYAGAYFLLMKLAGSFDDDTPDEVGIALLERLQAECETFAADQAFGAGAAALEQPDISYTTTDPDDIKPILRNLGRVISAALPKGYGFNLLLFTLAPGAIFYISDAERADVIVMMKEWLRQRTS